MTVSSHTLQGHCADPKPLSNPEAGRQECRATTPGRSKKQSSIHGDSWRNIEWFCEERFDYQHTVVMESGSSSRVKEFAPTWHETSCFAPRLVTTKAWLPSGFSIATWSMSGNSPWEPMT